MTRLLFLLLLATSFGASAVVIRHDVDDAKYRVPPTEFAALVDLPGEAHGVLIAPQWVVTAAHTIPLHSVSEIEINGECRNVERVIIHPGYRKLPEELLTGDAAPAMEFQFSNHDIALIKLTAPVTDTPPATLYSGSDELHRSVKIIGKGATGNGNDGVSPHAAHRTTLRRAFNTITSADGRWLGYVFDSGTPALALEGMLGSGDSGGPVLIKVNGEWQLAGLAAWVYWEGDVAAYRAGIYGQTSYHVRLSHYAEWLEGVMASERSWSDRDVVARWQWAHRCSSHTPVIPLGHESSSVNSRSDFCSRRALGAAAPCASKPAIC
jgi:hypothetical protein